MKILCCSNHLMKKVPLFLVALLLCGPVLAQEAFLPYDPSWHFINKNKQIVVKKIDEVTDGCWTNTHDSVDRAKLEFIRNGFEIEEDNRFAPVVYISALGYELNSGSCAVSVEVEVYTVGVREAEIRGMKTGSLYRYSLWSSGSILTGSKAGMNERIAKSHEQAIRSFLVFMNQRNREISDEIDKALTE